MNIHSDMETTINKMISLYPKPLAKTNHHIAAIIVPTNKRVLQGNYLWRKYP